MTILARAREKQLFEEILKSGKPEFLAVYGRRRVGKTHLVRNFFEGRGSLFHITGAQRQKTAQQLWNFAQVYADTFNNGETIETPRSWQHAFNLLRKKIQSISSPGRIILFLDELPWLATKKSGFVGALSYLWNRYLGADSRVILIVCGSAASWMIKNVINSRGGLYNRLTRNLRLKALNLSDTEVYLRGKGVRLSQKQIVEVYMAIGGIPAYLDNARPGRSSAQIITDLCFDPQSPLSGEFDRLFRSMFTNAELHSRAIRALLKARAGLSTAQWFEAANIRSGSVRQRVKQELLEAGFVAEDPVFGARKKGALIRLVDEYTIFNLSWQSERPHTPQALPPEHWRSLQSSNRWFAWSGNAFEGICRKHIKQIAKALGIHGIRYSSHSWRYQPDEGKAGGAQIDLVIDRADACINLCEIKFHGTEFSLSRDYAQRLEQKRAAFIQETGTRKTVFITLITAFGVVENDYYHQVVDHQIKLKALFADGG